MAWVSLIVAGIFEMFWATMMKLSEGFSKLNYSLLTIIGMIASFYFLAKSLHSLPLSLAYPIWTGIGAVGSILIGVFLFKDQLSIVTSFFVLLLVIGIIGIKVTSGH
ncbi:multidrug efflux SMR transporter [Enterococcus pseudoavium]|uniref:Multidrug efflux SMR transporter n=1 Tax=Enterococcus pseudoavium TaxID=44007 RepID=A0AAE4HZF2_9ENTE|nr:multidrug efflux SMR transporter [Enterococcus pseudoavium]MDT2736810.1 multidrug efflux SMR transporter [Enterococcus pseudoavium]MDT2754742.1 multidrug efflux SMR transporter [Enterococcus pseudoavium]MDT2770439.1 multidrug efflux SMR transporter [Enterococcus pseudoavium]